MTKSCLKFVCLGLSLFKVVLGASCGVKTFTSPSGTITTPNFSSNLYNGSQLQCYYRILVDAGNGIKLSWSTFDVRGRMPMCSGSSDYVEINVGLPWHSIGKYCSDNGSKPFDVYSPKNELIIVYHFESFGRGFQASYHSFSLKSGTSDLNDTCSSLSILTANSGIISSPRWPLPYTSLNDCYWKIEIGSRKNIKIAFMDFDLEGDYSCYSERISAKGGGHNETYNIDHVKEKLCGRRKPFYWVSSKEQIWINFKTDKANTYHRGFVAGYVLFESICNSNPCKNGGVCTVEGDNLNDYGCQCARGFYGYKNCDYVSSCPPEELTDDSNGACCIFPFKYRGVTYYSCITENNHGRYWCSLNAVYIAGLWAYCENPCTSSPCGNGLTCKATGYYNYTCDIKGPANNPCASNPCNNGATCTAVGDDRFSCEYHRFDGHRSHDDERSGAGVSSGTIIGSIVGIVVLLVLAFRIVYRSRQKARQRRQQETVRLYVPSLQVTLNHPSPNIPSQSTRYTPLRPTSQTRYRVLPPPYPGHEAPPPYSQVLEETFSQHENLGMEPFYSTALEEDVTNYPSVPPGYDSSQRSTPYEVESSYPSAPPAYDSLPESVGVPLPE